MNDDATTLAPPAEVVWSGMTESGVLVTPGVYSYQLKVQDRKHLALVMRSIRGTPGVVRVTRNIS